MPRVTQYIRNEDIDAWNAIENKSEWIHKHLTNKEPKKLMKPVKYPQKAFNGHKHDKVIQDLCKIHGTPLDKRGKCLQKGCKYA